MIRFTMISLAVTLTVNVIVSASPISSIATPQTITCANSTPCQSIQTAWKTYTTGGVNGWATRLWSGLCFNDAGPPTHDYSGNLIKCTECIEGLNGIISSQIKSYFCETNDYALCSGGGIPDLVRLQNWTYGIFDFGRSNKFPIDLPFGTAFIGDASTLPWPSPSAAKRIVETENSHKISEEAAPPNGTEHDNHASASSSPISFEQCLSIPVCRAAKRVFDGCINGGAFSNACFCLAGVPWRNNVFECAKCAEPFLNLRQGVEHGLETFANATLEIANAWCATGLSADVLLKLGEGLTHRYGSPVEFFNITDSGIHV